MPVRVLQSGKVYRQMFDAEVLLRKSIDARLHKLPDDEASSEHINLPELPHDKSRRGSSRKGTKSKGAGAFVSDERCKMWVEGMPNDSTTENPVLYR